MSALEKQTQKRRPRQFTHHHRAFPTHDGTLPVDPFKAISGDVVFGQLFGDGRPEQRVDEFGKELVLRLQQLGRRRLDRSPRPRSCFSTGFRSPIEHSWHNCKQVGALLAVRFRIISPITEILGDEATAGASGCRGSDDGR